MMLTHSDPETRTIFALLEKQRDDAVLEAGRQAARVEQLEAEVAALRPPKEDGGELIA